LERARRDASSEKIAPRDVAHKAFEVVAFGRQLSRLGKIPVEDSDLLWYPTK
jgi:hypothetical protein